MYKNNEIISQFEENCKRILEVKVEDEELIEIKKAISIYTIMLSENKDENNSELFELVKEINSIIEIYLVNK